MRFPKVNLFSAAACPTMTASSFFNIPDLSAEATFCALSIAYIRVSFPHFQSFNQGAVLLVNHLLIERQEL
ncbi:hypothetical protein, partial [Desulfococcus sp.]|uniref:hypothetical protein n=1 Tax=Desulfococcus sp. TaxID=2025834 RepID=UPI003D0EAA10